jgi:hypothetical protein
MHKSMTMVIFILVTLGLCDIQAETVSGPKTAPPDNATQNTYAQRIYTWTDSNGTLHFSNEPPPEGARNVEIIESTSSPDTTETEPSESENRRAYERMVEKAKAEARELEKARKAREAAAEAEKQRRAQEARDARVEAERAKLQKEIDDIQARGLSRTFSQGMKDNLIRKVQEQIDRLEQDPDAYFRAP